MFTRQLLITAVLSAIVAFCTVLLSSCDSVHALSRIDSHIIRQDTTHTIVTFDKAGSSYNVDFK